MGCLGLVILCPACAQAGSGLNFLLPPSAEASMRCPAPSNLRPLCAPHRRPYQAPPLPAPIVWTRRPFESGSHSRFTLCPRTPDLPGKAKTHLSPNPPGAPTSVPLLVLCQPVSFLSTLSESLLIPQRPEQVHPLPEHLPRSVLLLQLLPLGCGQ